MVKGFSSREREIINESLLDKGKALFESYGIKKTRIKDLTDAVGIAQGTFYNFFDSKEELYFTILEREEEIIKNKFISNKIMSNKVSPESLKTFLNIGFELIDSNPFLKQIMSGEEYNTILRKLPEEKVKDHIENDTDLLRPFIEKWQEEGLIIEESPEVISGLLRALFTISLHKKEIGEDVYQDTIRLLIDLISNGLVRRESEEI